MCLISDVYPAAGRSGDDYLTRLSAHAGRHVAVFDALVHRLGQHVELPDVEIDPAPVVAAAFFGNQHDLALDDSGITDQRAPRLDDDLGQIIAEMACDRRHHRPSVALHTRYLAAVMRRE